MTWQSYGLHRAHWFNGDKSACGGAVIWTGDAKNEPATTREREKCGRCIEIAEDKGNSMGWNDSDVVLEFHGTLLMATAKAWRFVADSWTEPHWVPKSQAALVDHDEATGQATLHIKKWLCEKNDWQEM